MHSEAATKELINRQGTVPLTDQDRAVLEKVDRSLADALALNEWWKQIDAANGYAERFELVRAFNPPVASFGFFDQVSLSGRTLPVMGVVEEMLYDQPKQAPSEKVRDEFREFILHYFLRVSAFRQPEAYLEMGLRSPPPLLQPFSWFPEKEERRAGFGYSQLYYKLRSSGLVAKFPGLEEFAIVDLREIGEKYEWIVAKVRIFDFNLTFKPLGPDLPQLVLPLREESYLVVSRDFILNEDNPVAGVLGRYGIGYAFIKDPTARGLLAYGPGLFDAAFKRINFEVLDSGETRVHMVFVVNRPQRILNLSLDPIGWTFRLADLMSFGLSSQVFAPVKVALERLPFRADGFDPLTTYISLANLLTSGLAAKEFGVSKEQLEKDFLVQHFMQHYQMIVGSLLTWRHIPDWLDAAMLPSWVVTGISS
jgi:hypothetical protein